MTNRDDELAELTAALDVTPPASFAEGVRARVARSRARTRQMWWGLAAAASVTLATLVMWRASIDAPAGGPGPVTHADARNVAEARPVTPTVEPVMPARAVGRDVTTPIGRVRAVADRPGSSSDREPRLEVITNQGALLRQLWAEAGNGAMVETALTSMEVVAAVPTVELKPISPIVVEPISVAPIVVGEIGSPGGRGGATPAIRRVDAAELSR